MVPSTHRDSNVPAENAFRLSQGDGRRIEDSPYGTRRRIRSIVVALIAAVGALLGLASDGRADGLIIIHNPPRPVPHHFSFAPLEVSYHHVSVKIDDTVATTSIDQEFYNPNGMELEGTYVFPLPPVAHVDKFAMDVNGKMTEAELLDANKARAFYEEIVRKARDPALLEYAGQGALKCRIYPIEPHSRKHVKISYSQLLKTDSGLTEYLYPLNTEKFSSRPLSNVSIEVSIESASPLKSVYCPSHEAVISRDGEHRATLRWERSNVRPDTDFKVVFSRGDSPVSVDLLTYRTGSDDGYFVLLASPGMRPDKARVQPKDVCFVIDTSGSMAENGGKKMEQARQALGFCLQNLNEGDRFNVVRFSTEVEPLFDNLKSADKSNLSRAQEFVESLKPIGGTAIDNALAKAVALRETDRRDDRPYIVIFLTDGQPTVGQTNEDKIVDSLSKVSGGSTRVFSFGIGTDVNTHLLDRIASATNAFSQYVLPAENLEVKLSSFYTKIKEPVLTNVRVKFEGDGLRTRELYPADLPDLFNGDQLVLFGRYSGSGPASVRVSGSFGGKERTFTQDVRFAERQSDHAFIPQLWATRRVGYLLDQIRLHGENKELKDEVTRLAREYGIVTPYTAYLILEDERGRRVPMERQTLREMGEDAHASSLSADRYKSARDEASAPDRRSGAGAVANAQNLQNLRSQAQQEVAGCSATELDKQPAPTAMGGAASPSGYRRATNYAQQARVVNNRAFYQNGDTWTDSAAQQTAGRAIQSQTLKFASDEYFSLLKAHPEASAWLSLGENVDVVIGDTLYQVRG